MVVVAVCGVLLVAGVVCGVAWGGRSFRAPGAESTLSAVGVARRYVRSVGLGLLAGVAAGVTVIGGGGRLAMRLLAVTGGDDAQGRITEADEVVGEVTIGGTVSFVLFNGVFFGIIAGLLYVAVRRLLPSGLVGGAVFGLALLIIVGTTIDPLRPDNPDFDLVGPGWLAVLVFGLLAFAFGVALTGFVARLSEWLPLPSLDRRVLLRYSAPAALAVLGSVSTIIAVIAGAAVVAGSRVPPLAAAARSPRTVLVGRAIALVLVLAALPGTVTALADIAGR